MNDVDLGWLAGVYDSEGSIGIGRSIPQGQRTFVLEPQVQMETTCKGTAEHIVALLKTLDLSAVSYFYRGRKPQHKPSHNIRIARFADANRLAHVLADVSVTKRRQWMLLRDFTDRRLVGVELDDLGRIKRGGTRRRRPYDATELRIYDRMKEANRRGN